MWNPQTIPGITLSFFHRWNHNQIQSSNWDVTTENLQQVRGGELQNAGVLLSRQNINTNESQRTCRANLLKSAVFSHCFRTIFLTSVHRESYRPIRSWSGVLIYQIRRWPWKNVAVRGADMCTRVRATSSRWFAIVPMLQMSHIPSQCNLDVISAGTASKGKHAKTCPAYLSWTRKNE